MWDAGTLQGRTKNASATSNTASKMMRVYDMGQGIAILRMTLPQVALEGKVLISLQTLG